VKYLILCQGPNALEVVKILLENELLKFSWDELVNNRSVLSFVFWGRPEPLAVIYCAACLRAHYRFLFHPLHRLSSAEKSCLYIQNIPQIYIFFPKTAIMPTELKAESAKF